MSTNIFSYGLVNLENTTLNGDFTYPKLYHHASKIALELKKLITEHGLEDVRQAADLVSEFIMDAERWYMMKQLAEQRLTEEKEKNKHLQNNLEMQKNHQTSFAKAVDEMEEEYKKEIDQLEQRLTMSELETSQRALELTKMSKLERDQSMEHKELLDKNFQLKMMMERKNLKIKQLEDTKKDLEMIVDELKKERTNREDEMIKLDHDQAKLYSQITLLQMKLGTEQPIKSSTPVKKPVSELLNDQSVSDELPSTSFSFISQVEDEQIDEMKRMERKSLLEEMQEAESLKSEGEVYGPINREPWEKMDNGSQIRRLFFRLLQRDVS
ncbi:hypothetical protein SNEBB_007504 [Seison nebaliae]|nr:hypothetical protein SNEBB_007504 [Seison nebaliae]